MILDIAVPRNFDPRIHDGDQTCIFNIDDLEKIREHTLRERRSHLPAAEAIVHQEMQRFLSDWRRRRHGGVIAQLDAGLRGQAERRRSTAPFSTWMAV